MAFPHTVRTPKAEDLFVAQTFHSLRKMPQKLCSVMTWQLSSIIPANPHFQKIIREIWQTTEIALVNWIH